MLGTDIEDRASAMQDGMAAAENMRAYAADLAIERRRRPTGDLVSELLAAEVEGRKLTDGEFQAFFMLLFNAGSDTTKCLLCFGLDLLIDHPDAAMRLREHPELIPGAVEEMLRYEPPVIQFRRTATQDVSLHGRMIAAGDKVVVFCTFGCVFLSCDPLSFVGLAIAILK